MEKGKKSKWAVNISLCVCTLLYHIQGIHETAANLGGVRKSADSDERTALDQALLLVELLKTEYAKVLKENDNLKKKNKDETNVQSCATSTTTERMSENLNSKLFENTFQHRRHWRPLAANNDYYGDPTAKGKLRRILDYYDASGPEPDFNETSRTSAAASTHKITTIPEAHSSVAITTTNTTTEMTAKTTTETATKTTTEKSDVSISSITEKKDSKYNDTVSSPSTTTIETSTNENIVPTAKTDINSRASISNNKDVDLKVSITENKIHKKTSLSSNTYSITNFVTVQSSSSRSVKKLMLFLKKVSEAKVISSTHVTQPELSQAAAELAKELGLAVPGGFGMGPRSPVLWRGSTKVYLADSTPYPLPLPENHAFCYTNPHSALCRTLV